MATMYVHYGFFQGEGEIKTSLRFMRFSLVLHQSYLVDWNTVLQIAPTNYKKKTNATFVLPITSVANSQFR